MDINDIPSRPDFASILARFEAKFIPEPMSGCWLWFGAADGKGYGHMKVDGCYLRAPRLSLVLYKGIVSQNALHYCDNPPCVNPDHVFDGSQSMNISDAYARGRRAHVVMPCGEANKKSKLTDGDVIEIRHRLKNGERPEAMAPGYGVSFQAIYAIKNGVTWRHLLPAETVGFSQL